MFVTIWMCTHEWSLISRRATAFTFATCHHAFSCVSAFTRWTIVRSFRFARGRHVDPHPRDRFRGGQAGFSLGLLGDRRLDPLLGLGIEAHASNPTKRLPGPGSSVGGGVGAARRMPLVPLVRWRVAAASSSCRSAKYMSVHATATNGTTTVFEMTSETKLSTPSGSQTVAIVTMSDATITAPIVMMITPKTFQPCPRTSSRLRPNDSPADLPSITIEGTIRLQIVEQEEARHDQEDEPDRDPEAGEDAGDDQRGQARLDAPEHLADGGLLPVAHVPARPRRTRPGARTCRRCSRGSRSGARASRGSARAASAIAPRIR